MVNIEGMTREELMEVIKIKDEILAELREEVEAYAILVEELQAKLGIKDFQYTGNGD